MRVGFLGQGIGIGKCVEALRENGHGSVFIVTHPREEHEKEDEIHRIQKAHGVYESVFETAKRFRIPILESSDVNQEETIEWILKWRAELIVSIGCRSIIRRPFLDRVGAKVLNLHTAPLPRYRGRASDSWMILNDERKAYGVCHYVDEGIDNGDVIAKVEYEIRRGSYPLDIYKTRISIIDKLLLKAMQNIQDPSFVPIKQAEKEATYFPGLRTEIDGIIDWNQDAQSIERHVRAFGRPYVGAFTFCEGKKVRVIGGHVDEEVHRLHPNTVGLIFGTDGEGGVKVSTGEGVYVISEIEIDNGTKPPYGVLRLGAYFRGCGRK